MGFWRHVVAGILSSCVTLILAGLTVLVFQVRKDENQDVRLSFLEGMSNSRTATLQTMAKDLGSISSRQEAMARDLSSIDTALTAIRTAMIEFVTKREMDQRSDDVRRRLDTLEKDRRAPR